MGIFKYLLQCQKHLINLIFFLKIPKILFDHHQVSNYFLLYFFRIFQNLPSQLSFYYFVSFYYQHSC